MESLLPPLFPEPLDPAELPEPREWTCEHCKEPMNVWDWLPQPPEITARGITPPSAACSACLIELADPGFPAFRVEHQQRWHHQMWFRVGEPPGTLIAWPVQLPDRNGKVNPDGTPVSYTTYIYCVLVDWWNEDWPQLRFPWSLDLAWPQLVVLGARVIAKPDTRGRYTTEGTWIFRWLWPNPAWPETCLLDPPNVDLTDGDAVRLNHARRTFYAFAERRGLETGDKVAWPHNKAEWQEAGRRAEATLVDRFHRHPTDGEMAREMGVTKPTFDRRKREWGPPTAQE